MRVLAKYVYFYEIVRLFRKHFAAEIYFVCSPLQIPHSQTTPPPPLAGAANTRYMD